MTSLLKTVQWTSVVLGQNPKSLRSWSGLLLSILLIFVLLFLLSPLQPHFISSAYQILSYLGFLHLLHSLSLDLFFFCCSLSVTFFKGVKFPTPPCYLYLLWTLFIWLAPDMVNNTSVIPSLLLVIRAFENVTINW